MMQIIGGIPHWSFILVMLSTTICAGAESVDQATRARALDILRAGLHAEPFWPSMHAAEALTLAGYPEEVIPPLTRRLQVEQDDRHRCGLARELYRAGDESSLPVLFEVLASEDPYGHGHACESLFKINQIGDGLLLKRRRDEADQPIKQMLAAASLARRGDQASLQLIRDQLQNDDDNVARIAAWLLSTVGVAADISPLRVRLGKVELPSHQIFFLASLATLGEPQARKELKSSMTSDDAQIRVYAAEYCGTASIESAIPHLKALLDDEDLDVRIRAAQSLLMLSQE
ncbi:MAG: HEAT repeat domain-containing protein [Pirellulaceae bacterium]